MCLYKIWIGRLFKNTLIHLLVFKLICPCYFTIAAILKISPINFIFPSAIDKCDIYLSNAYFIPIFYVKEMN